MLDPSDPTSFNHRFVFARPSGHRYHLIDQPPAHWKGPIHEAPTLLLCHGFPDLWVSHSEQVLLLVALMVGISFSVGSTVGDTVRHGQNHYVSMW